MVSSGFRVQATHLSITYPQASFDLNAGLEFLRGIVIGSKRVVEAIICSETHQDGTLHRHAYVKFNGRIDLRDPRKFDFEGRHPNILRTENVPAWKNYIREDGEFLEWSNNESISDNLFAWARDLPMEEYFEKARRANIPFGYTRFAYDSAQSELAHITFREDPNPFLNIPMGRELETFNFELNRTNVIVGPSGCGKTVISLRKMMKPLLFVSHIDQLKSFSQSIHRSILLDDMCFSHLPLQSQIHLVDRALPRSIHRRYGTTLIPAGIQITITCNEIPFTYHEAIARRCNRLTIQ